MGQGWEASEGWEAGGKRGRSDKGGSRSAPTTHQAIVQQVHLIHVQDAAVGAGLRR